MKDKYDALIIGGGITGASTAYHLKKFGSKDVILLERHRPASGGTGKSAAIVRQHYSTELMARLALNSVILFENMNKELNIDNAFYKTGYIMLVPEELMEKAANNLEMQKNVGIETDWLPKSQWKKFVPWLNIKNVSGVIYEPKGGRADPIRVTEGYLNKFTELGGELRTKTFCREIIKESGRVIGVVVDEGIIYSDVVVNAAGPWSKPIAEQAGIELPLKSFREQDTIWESRISGDLPNLSISNAVDSIYFVPQGNKRFLIGKGFPKKYFEVDPYNYKLTADDEFISNIKKIVEDRFPILKDMKLINSYAALYDVTPDWYPFVGKRSSINGYFDANGGSGHGFKIGPAIGCELAKWIINGKTEKDFEKLSFDRIEKKELFEGAYGGNRG